MSDTPRTDEQELAYEAEDGSTYVHTTFARKLERENNELRKTLIEQIIEADTMRKHYHTVEALLFEAQPDKERLDWLLYRYDMGVIMYRDEFLENREDIDKAMEESVRLKHQEQYPSLTEPTD